MFQTFAAVLMLILFLVPGYIWRSVENRFIYLDNRIAWEKFALGLLARSTGIYLILFPSLYRAWKHQIYDRHPIATAMVGILVLLLLPVFFGTVFGVARRRHFVSRLLLQFFPNWNSAHQKGTAWEAAFGEAKSCMIIVTTKDGTEISGFLGPGSHFSADSENRDLFISDVVLSPPADLGKVFEATDEENLSISEEGVIGEFILDPQSEGIYISGDQIAFIELRTL
jgi:hypothetical protein